MAGNSGAIKAGRAFVEVFADNSSLQRTLKSSQRQLKAFGAGVAAAGAALVIVGPAIGGLAGILSIASTAFAAFGAVIGTVGTVLGACLTPLGAVGAAAVALGSYFLATKTDISGVVKWLGSAFDTVAADLKIAFDAIKGALSNGEWGKAAKVLFAAVQVEFQRGTNELASFWGDLTDSIQTNWEECFEGVLDALAGDYGPAIKKAWLEVMDFMQDAFSELDSIMSEHVGKWLAGKQRIGVYMLSRVAGADHEEAMREGISFGGKTLDREAAFRKRIEDEKNARELAKQQAIAKIDADALLSPQQRSLNRRAAREEAKRAREAAAAAALKKATDNLSTAAGDALRQPVVAQRPRLPIEATRPVIARSPVEAVRPGAAAPAPAGWDVDKFKSFRWEEFQPKSQDVVGTFNAAGARGLAGNGLTRTMQEAVRILKQSTNIQEKIEQNTKQGMRFT